MNVVWEFMSICHLNITRAGLLAINWIGLWRCLASIFLFHIAYTHARIIHWNQHHIESIDCKYERIKISNQFFFVTHLFFWSWNNFFSVRRRYMNITSLTSSSIKFSSFHVLLNRCWWFLSDFSSLRFCLNNTNASVWFWMQFCNGAFWLMLSLCVCMLLSSMSSPFPTLPLL